MRESAARLIRAEAEKTYPDECCGFLLGETAADGARWMTEALPSPNTRADGEKYHRFRIEAEEFMRAELEARRRGRDILGIYHSHPDHPAVPSDYDREQALPFYSYVIVAVAKGRAGAMNSWELRSDRTGFEAETMALAD
jgi:proteasome lid subunit RPN8/RPN11